MGKEKYWELIRGVYNCKFNKASNEKEEKEMIEEMWSFCFNELKKEFCIKRYNEINEIELELGIKKSDKRIRKTRNEDINSDDKIVNNKRKITKI
ncbi:unnamed protein product [Rhizophagus irregularis]|nr:unnamed protein product [Rhizophagus irregularis]CAB5384443.1 unnamed protein product [Rhizophagus irregularis]